MNSPIQSKTNARLLFSIACAAVLFAALPLQAADAPAKSPPAKQKYADFAMAHQGDPQRGKSLFEDEKRLACARCHAIEGKQSKVGPNLFAIGDKFGRRELVESILSPSATIAEGYGTTIITTKSGDVLSGVLKDADASTITLATADGQALTIKTQDINERRASAVSTMPEGLQTSLTVQEFSDLIEYLATLKVADNLATAQRGMPATIDEVAHPVSFKPFNVPEHRFQHPTWFGPIPGLPDSYAVVEHESGKVWRLEKSGSTETKTIFLDTGRFIPGSHGIMGIVFHPHFTQNHRYFVVKQPVENKQFFTQICEAQASSDLKSDSGKPLRELLRIYGSDTVHCGGNLEFGPDGYLYIGMGDSGPQQDPHGNAQNLQSLRGKMLRIDVDHADAGKPYAIPPDNPFVGKSDILPEIWAVGLREPWRYSFDPVTGDLWVGDVGQDLYEEVDILKKGQNYGWSVYEGFAPFSNQYRRPDRHFTAPTFAYSRKYGVSVTGGYVYRGDPKSSFYGIYICADFQTRHVFGLTQKNGQLKSVKRIGLAPQRVVSFGRGEKGQLFLVGYEGTIYEIDLSGARFE